MNNRMAERFSREIERTREPDRRVGLLIEYVCALVQQGARIQAHEALAKADELASRTPLPHRLPDVHRTRAVLLAAEGRLHEAIGAVVNARELAAAFGREELAVRCDALLAVFLARQDGNVAALPIARRALERAQARQDATAMRDALLAIANICRAAGDFDRAAMLLRRARDYAERSDDVSSTLAILAQSAYVELLHLRVGAVHGDANDCLAAALSSIDLALAQTSMDETRDAAANLRALRELLVLMQGRATDQPLAALRELADLAAADNTVLIPELAIIVLAELAQGHLRTGEHERARHDVMSMLTLAEQAGGIAGIHQAHDVAARVLAGLDSIAAAEVHRAAAKAALALLEARRATLRDLIARELSPHLVAGEVVAPR